MPSTLDEVLKQINNSTEGEIEDLAQKSFDDDKELIEPDVWEMVASLVVRYA